MGNSPWEQHASTSGFYIWEEVCCYYSSVTKLCPAVYEPMNGSTPGFPLLYYLLEFAQTYANWVTISSLVSPFSSCLWSFPASRSFQMSQFFTSGGQSIGVSALSSVLPMNIQDLFPLGWTGLISLQSKGLSRVFSNTIVQKHQFFGAQLSLWSNFHVQNHSFD